MNISLTDLSHIHKTLNEAISNEKIKSITVFLGDLSNVKQRVKITRFKNAKNDFRLTIGKSNYAEREYLKICRRAKSNPRRTWISKITK